MKALPLQENGKSMKASKQIEQQTGQGIIAVGIDNGGADRMAEYSHAPNSQYGGGKSDAYIRFIIETLKPFIDQNFRTLTDASNTGIMGSSMGGLLSMYAAVEYSEVFGKVGVFSPSFLVYGRSILLAYP
jgi:predicted alpha/beta superfamily hydrolase